jgi:oxygen-dependent protoporphyrinogen oxidase
MFTNRAPEGHVACETLIGGRRHPERLECDDETLVREAYADLRYILRIGHKPVYTKVVRMGNGIPQLEREYPALNRWRESFIASQAGLAICGFGWDGIGVNDMVKHASRIANALLTTGKPVAAAPEIKGIYF